MVIAILKKIGLDKAILFTSSSVLLGAAGGVIILFFIARFLSDFEQGFYFTFASIASIQIFFELGFNKVITQFVAHEYAKLETNGNKLNGDPVVISRVGSLFRMMIKWYFIISIIYFLAVLFFGFYFFKINYHNDNVDWVTPWIILSVANSLNLLISPILSFLQGLSQVKEISKILLFQQIGKLAVIFFSFIMGGKLYSIGFGVLISFLTTVFLIYYRYFHFLMYLWNYQLVSKMSYWKEIFPYQWRIAVSWLSGFFIFNLFNPLIFKLSGPIVAGQAGMTLTALTGIQALASAWISTKIPLFSSLISRKNFVESNFILRKTVFQSTSVIIALICFFIIFLIIINSYNIQLNKHNLKQRFLELHLSILLSSTFILNHIISCLATYIRCHKKDPYLLNSIVASIIVVISMLYFGHNFGINGVIISYFIVMTLIFPWSIYIFFRNKIKLEFIH